MYQPTYTKPIMLLLFENKSTCIVCWVRADRCGIYYRVLGKLEMKTNSLKQNNKKGTKESVSIILSDLFSACSQQWPTIKCKYVKTKDYVSIVTLKKKFFIEHYCSNLIYMCYATLQTHDIKLVLLLYFTYYETHSKTLL